MKFLRFRAGLCFMVLTLLMGRATSQETAPPPTPATPATASDNSKNDELREQTIYIPYSKLREAFEREGRGVFVPYEQFQELWRQARQSQKPPAEQVPPLAAVITEIESEASVERDVVVVKATIKLEVLGKGWHLIPLRLADTAIRSASLDGEPARITFDPQAGYNLLIKNESTEAKRQTLALEYARSFNKSPGLNTVQFAAPQAPINRWKIRIPQKGVKVNVQPFIAATEIPSDAAATTPPENPAALDASSSDETVLLAFVGAAPEVRIDWTPKTEGATGLEALATVQSQQEVVLEEGVLRTRVRLLYEISRAEIPQLRIELPSDQKVTGVFDANVRQWEVAAEGDKQIVTVHLFEPAKNTQSIQLELEKFSEQLVMSEVAVPVVRALGVGRQQGVLVVRVGDELRAEPVKRSGLLQQDASELPPPLQGATWTFAYRYATLPFELVLRAEKVNPRIRTEELVEVFLEPEQATVSLLALFDIQQAGVFQLEADIPAGYELRQVRGQAAAGAEPAAVDSHLLEGEQKTRLKVNLARKAIGRVGLLIELRKRLQDPNLLAPTGTATQLAWPLPRTAMAAEAVNGRFVLFAPESLRVNPGTQTGLRTVSLAEAMQGVESQRASRFPGLREVLVFVYGNEPAELSLTVERRKPQVSVRQLLIARIDSGVVKYEATFHFEVRYSPVDSLRIDVPTSLASEIRNLTRGVRETPIEPRPADAAEGYTPWKFVGEREFLGEVSIQLGWEQKSDELEVGKSADYSIPVLRPMEVDRAWGQVVITKAETLDIYPKAGFSGLRPVDPQHDLMPGASVPNAARAFEFHEDWSLAVTATRYELEDVKRTSIERAVVRMVVTRSDHVTVQALYRVRSAVQRLLLKLPKGATFDSDPLRVNGRPVPPEHGDQDQVFVPLVGQQADTPFLLEVRYTVPQSYSRLDLPVFPDQPPVQSEPAVQKVHLLVYLPDELALLGSRGPWTSEQTDWYQRINGFTSPLDGRNLVAWVSEGISLQNSPFDSFPTDGDLYVFTTLRPAPPPDGSLRLIATSERGLNALLYGGLLLVAVVLVRQTAISKLVVLALLIIVIVGVGVFSPTFALQILDIKLFLAIGLVVLIWVIAGLIWPTRRVASVQARPVHDSDSSEFVAVSNKSAPKTNPADKAETDQPPGDRTSPPANESDKPQSPFADTDRKDRDEPPSAGQGGATHAE